MREEEKMGEGRRKSKVMRVNEIEEDIISQIPENLIHFILSLLSTNDAVRTSVLSKHWKDQWKFTPNINLDQKTMPSGQIQKYIRSTRSAPNPIVIAQRWIESVIDQHNGPLNSCRIQHMVESLEEAQNWVRKLLIEKKVKELSMECDPPVALFNIFYLSLVNPFGANRSPELFVPFEILAGFEAVELKNYHLYTSSSPPPSLLNSSDDGNDYPQKLKTIKLTLVLMPPVLSTFLSECLSLESIVLNECNVKEGSNQRKFRINNPSLKFLDMVLGSITYIEICSVNLEVLLVDSVFYDGPQSVVIVAPNLKVLHCYCTQKSKGLRLNVSEFTYIWRILQGLLGSVTFEGKRYPSVYENLESLHVQLNLRNERDSVLLANVLKSCNSLVNLEIKNEDMEELDEEHDREKWRTGSFKCIIEKLKTVSIRGFKGKELELDFLKCLITKSEKMEDITIWFDDDSKLEDVTETLCLILSVPKSSENLSITLKPGKQYLASDGGSFNKWISTLEY